MSGRQRSRRYFLSLLGTVGTLTLAGCKEGPENSGTETPRDTPQSDTSTDATTSSPSPTTIDDKAPSITHYEAEPLEFGKKLSVLLEGEDNRELEYAAISYGNRTLESNPEKSTVELTGILEDITDAEPSIPGQIVYTLRDDAGNESEKAAYADEQSPLLVVRPKITEVAGEIQLLLKGKDSIGLHELQIEFNENSVSVVDLTGQKEMSLRRTATADQYSSLIPGKMNSVAGTLEDAMGNTARKRTDQYVRKYDVMEDTRIDFAAQYQPFFKEFRRFEMDGRTPSIGQYNEVPYSQWVYERHLDQMSGFGVTTVRIDISTAKADTIEIQATEQFLDSALINQVDIAAHYVIASHLWLKNSEFTAENYREDLIEPHMTYIRDNIFSRDNVAAYDGRPIMEIWNPEVWLWDYPKGRIMDEWGGYEEFFDDIRSHLKLSEKDPFLVGGFNDWGIDGYDYSNNKELISQFDGISTWVGGGAWGEDNFVTQKNAIEFIKSNWQGHLDMIEEHDTGQEFIPMVFPGFNEFKDPNRRTPRSPGFFAELMKLAEEYRTTDMVWTPPYNNWEEATHYEPGVFEPGPFGDDNYGTAYLEKVKQFQLGRLN